VGGETEGEEEEEEEGREINGEHEREDEEKREEGGGGELEREDEENREEEEGGEFEIDDDGNIEEGGEMETDDDEKRDEVPAVPGADLTDHPHRAALLCAIPSSVLCSFVVCPDHDDGADTLCTEVIILFAFCPPIRVGIPSVCAPCVEPGKDAESCCVCTCACPCEPERDAAACSTWGACVKDGTCEAERSGLSVDGADASDREFCERVLILGNEAERGRD
jgi:hypothetical protein